MTEAPDVVEPVSTGCIRVNSFTSSPFLPQPPSEKVKSDSKEAFVDPVDKNPEPKKVVESPSVVPVLNEKPWNPSIAVPGFKFQMIEGGNEVRIRLLNLDDNKITTIGDIIGGIDENFRFDISFLGKSFKDLYDSTPMAMLFMFEDFSVSDCGTFGKGLLVLGKAEDEETYTPLRDAFRKALGIKEEEERNLYGKLNFSSGVYTICEDEACATVCLQADFRMIILTQEQLATEKKQKEKEESTTGWRSSVACLGHKFRLKKNDTRIGKTLGLELMNESDKIVTVFSDVCDNPFRNVRISLLGMPERFKDLRAPSFLEEIFMFHDDLEISSDGNALTGGVTLMWERDELYDCNLDVYDALCAAVRVTSDAMSVVSARLDFQTGEYTIYISDKKGNSSERRFGFSMRIVDDESEEGEKPVLPIRETDACKIISPPKDMTKDGWRTDASVPFPYYRMTANDSRIIMEIWDGDEKKHNIDLTTTGFLDIGGRPPVVFLLAPDAKRVEFNHPNFLVSVFCFIRDETYSPVLCDDSTIEGMINVVDDDEKKPGLAILRSGLEYRDTDVLSGILDFTKGTFTIKRSEVDSQTEQSSIIKTIYFEMKLQ